VGVVGVQLLVDGSKLGQELATAPYSASWDTTKVVNGTHLVAAIARDQAGNHTTSASVSVTVSNSTSSGPEVVPVMIVASDLAGDSAGISAAAARFNTVITYVRDWYRANAGKTYALGAMRTMTSNQTASEWESLSQISTDAAHRYDYFWAASNLVSPTTNSANRYQVGVYAGVLPDTWLGAASAGAISVSAPRATSLTCVAYTADNNPPIDSRCSDAVYGAGHEEGHTFGLAHSCDVYPSDPNCSQSIMQVGKPPSAILLPGEVQTLLNTSWFYMP
jgi:hypothetical protein